MENRSHSIVFCTFQLYKLSLAELQQVQVFESPKIKYEQYPTSPYIGKKYASTQFFIFI